MLDVSKIISSIRETRLRPAGCQAPNMPEGVGAANLIRQDLCTRLTRLASCLVDGVLRLVVF